MTRSLHAWAARFSSQLLSGHVGTEDAHYWPLQKQMHLGAVTTEHATCSKSHHLLNYTRQIS